MRGKAFGLMHMRLPKGITPAYAGKSFAHSLIPPLLGDHPRVCGEKTKKIP